jgi:hypothetical protein
MREINDVREEAMLRKERLNPTQVNPNKRPYD